MCACERRGGGGSEKERERERESQRDERERERPPDRQTDRENSNSNSKTLILKDSSVRFIGISLTASPLYTTNTSKHNTRNIISTIKQLINAVSQFL